MKNIAGFFLDSTFTPALLFWWQNTATTMPKRKVEASSSPSTSPEPVGKKRKFNRDEIPDDEKLEVDVSLPEPPSKKALRAEKKRQKEEKKAAKADRKANKAADKGSQEEPRPTKTHEYKP